MLKFEAKKGDFAKIWQKLGSPGSTAHDFNSFHQRPILQLMGFTKSCGLKSVQSALSDLKRPPDSPSAIIRLSLLNSILMVCFLKQSFAQTCLKEMDNGKLQQFNYSRSLITNRGTVERGT